ncbi:hypothetical protein BH11ACT4_BH11ACT4_25660 [soil metagenome]
MSESRKVVDRGTNSGAMGDTLPTGQHAAVETYVVVNGDNAWDIARRFGVGEEQLIDEGGSRLGAQVTIYPGDRIYFGDPLTGKDYDCFFGQGPAAGKGKSCYDE